MAQSQTELLQGTLDMLILKSLAAAGSWKPRRTVGPNLSGD